MLKVFLRSSKGVYIGNFSKMNYQRREVILQKNVTRLSKIKEKKIQKFFPCGDDRED